MPPQWLSLKRKDRDRQWAGEDKADPSAEIVRSEDSPGRAHPLPRMACSSQAQGVWEKEGVRGQLGGLEGQDQPSSAVVSVTWLVWVCHHHP